MKAVIVCNKLLGIAACPNCAFCEIAKFGWMSSRRWVAQSGFFESKWKMRLCGVDARCALLYEWFRYRVLYVCNKVVIFWLKNTIFTTFLPVVDDDYFHVKKKPCSNDRDKNPPLDKDRDTMPGLEEQSSPGPANSRRTNNSLVF